MFPLFAQLSQDVDSDDDDAYVQMDPMIVPGELTLTEFVKNFSHTLPQRVSFQNRSTVSYIE